MSEKLFWWGPHDVVLNSPAPLWYVDSSGNAVREPDPIYGAYSIQKLLADGYVEISWESARAMGAPV